jgi:hypothetical protein
MTIFRTRGLHLLFNFCIAYSTVEIAVKFESKELHPPASTSGSARAIGSDFAMKMTLMISETLTM